MAGMMFTIASPTGAPSLADASLRLGLDPGELDPSFGVILLDPREGLYSVLVDERSIHRVAGSSAHGAGPFANPVIGTFGPPEPDKP